MSLEAAFEVGRLFLPLKTIADQFSLAQKDLFIRLPGLRGYWPMSAVNYLGRAIDHSNASVNLQRTGAPTYAFDGNAYVQLGVATDFLHTASGELDFTGTEAWIDSGIRGLTFGGWFWIDVIPVAASGLISKHGVAPQYGFTLIVSTAGSPQVYISSNGTNNWTVVHSPLTINTWHFIVARFTPSTELAVFVNDAKVVNTTTIPAAINVSTQNFEIGRYSNDNSRIIEGRARDVFICASALSDATLSDLYQASLPA